MLTLLAAAILATLPTALHAVKGDLIPDGQVNFTDFFAFADNFGRTGAPFEVITVPDDVPDLQTAIDSVRAGGIVYLAAGTYELGKGIHITRSDLTILGPSADSVVVRLRDHVNQPVFLIGTDIESPTTAVERVTLRGITIDGNRGGQDQETDLLRPWIRNNGIDVRKAKNLLISDVVVHGTRSGGIVVSWGSERVSIWNVSAYDNQFDGIALYTSDEVHVSHFACYENLAAGLSLDNDLSNVTFSNGECRENGSVGIFARQSTDLSFINVAVQSSGQHGVFMSYTSGITGSGVSRAAFVGCQFSGNKDQDFYVGGTADSPSTRNYVVNCTLDQQKVTVEADAQMEIWP